MRDRDDDQYGSQGGGTYSGDYPDRQRFFDPRRREQSSWAATFGPDSHQRSDKRIREDISDRLTDDGDIDPRDIEVAVNQGDVTLTGSVESGQVKRAVEDLVEFVPGVRDIRNELRVSRAGNGHSSVE